jgi:hypothetical protein
MTISACSFVVAQRETPSICIPVSERLSRPVSEHTERRCLLQDHHLSFRPVTSATYGVREMSPSATRTADRSCGHEVGLAGGQTDGPRGQEAKTCLDLEQKQANFHISFGFIIAWDSYLWFLLPLSSGFGTVAAIVRCVICAASQTNHPPARS